MTPREIAYRIGQQAKALARVAEARDDSREIQALCDELLAIKSKVARLDHQRQSVVS